MRSRLQFCLLVAAVNVAVWLAFSWQRTEGKAKPESKGAEGGTRAGPSSSRPSTSVVVVRTNAFEWAQLESEDYRTYINRLRKVGCPEETIRDIIIADLEKLMAPELQRVDGTRDSPKYWQPKTLERTVEALEKLGKKQDVDFRKREVIRELLGVDLASERARARGERDFYQERLSFLDPDKEIRVRIAMEKANRAEALVREQSWLDNDELTGADKKQLREIQLTKEQEIAQLLTPEELEQYNLWFSPSAYRTRDAFLALEPNEQDFLALYRMQKEFDEQWDGVDPGTLSPEQKLAFQQAQTKFNQQVRDYLGPERYEKFVQSREPDFQSLQETITQFGLKPDVSTQVYNFKKALLEERARVSASGNLEAGQKQELLRALSDETEQAVVEAMGPRAYRYYVRTGAAKWISP